MFCLQTLLEFLSHKALNLLLPNSERVASCVGNDTGLKMDNETRRFTTECGKWPLMLESNAWIYGIATVSRYTLIVVALSLPVKLLLIMMSCSDANMAMLVSTSEHHSAPASFKCSSSDTRLSRMMGSLLKSVAFRCMKQLSLAGRSRTTDNKLMVAIPLYVRAQSKC